MLHLLLARTITAADSNFAVNAYWYADPNTPFVYYESTVTVPPLLSKDWATTFLWPGLQPLSASTHFLPLNNGVLQPVLTFGVSCAPNPSNIPLSLNSWWISAQYVNTYVSPVICTGGNAMNVNGGDKLQMIFQQKVGSTIWQQTVNNLNNGNSVSFSYDMQGQEQAWAEFVMETPSGWHSNPPQFVVSNIILKSAPGSAIKCDYQSSVYAAYPGAALSCDNPVLSGNTCAIAKCLFNNYANTSTVTAATASQIFTSTSSPNPSLTSTASTITNSTSDEVQTQFSNLLISSLLLFFLI
ncbi:hypothetical protein HDV06_003532 [Boothiomyces sp. JEL0866]|nr:hypothetical protein HDV06_003532 [Boothiomyces sp. JEL0866]